MRFKLEVHYDEVHSQRYSHRRNSQADDAPAPAKKQRGRRNSNVMFTRAAKEQLHNKFEALASPAAVKDLLRKPGDEMRLGEA